MPVTDSTLIKISWDTITETHTVAELREKYDTKTNNLFDSDGSPWVRQLSDYTICQHSLEDVLVVIQPGEQWTCDNCTVTLNDTVHRLQPCTVSLVGGAK